MRNKQTTVPVLLNFFNRPEPLRQVFEAVRKVKPMILFLSQDGARVGNATDRQNIELCRQVVDNIDWECEVHYNYSEKNLGCGRRMSSAISWAFEKVDRLMILEDDCVPGESFFPFCEELLEVYKNDERISMISAMNHLEHYENYSNSSYFFCNSGAIWGWATWKREWELYDFELKFMEENDVMRLIQNSAYPSYYKRDLISQGRDRYLCIKSGKKLSSWTFQFNIIRVMQHQLTIVPRENMVSNVGLSSASTHASGSIRQIPKGIQSFFYMPAHILEFPLKHPQYVYCEDAFDRLVWKKMGMEMPVVMYRKVESIIRQIIYGNKAQLIKKAKQKIRKW